VITMTASGYWPRQSHAHATFDKNMSSTASDFRLLTPLVLMRALRSAGTIVHEPVHRFYLEAPADTLGPIARVLSVLHSVPEAPSQSGSSFVLRGLIPAARVHELRQQLPGLTSGEGFVESTFDSYQPARGAAPTRARTDHNPLDRAHYLRQVTGRQ
jgi:ribosomal protection tetracycline resistance protein